jgi:hypothetical protein
MRSLNFDWVATLLTVAATCVVFPCILQACSGAQSALCGAVADAVQELLAESDLNSPGGLKHCIKSRTRRRRGCRRWPTRRSPRIFRRCPSGTPMFLRS